MNLTLAKEIIGIDVDDAVTMDDLKRKYRRLALQFHPDKNGNSVESSENFKLIQESYEYLQEYVISQKDSLHESGDTRRNK